MKEIRTHCFDSDLIRKKPAYFPLALALLLLSIYPLYYGISDFLQSYQRHPEHSFSVRLLSNFENRLLLILLFLVAVILCIISFLRKNAYTHIFFRNYLVEHTDSQDVYHLVEITKKVYSFDKSKDSYSEKTAFLFNLNNVKDYVYVESPSNEKLKRLKINISSIISSGSGRTSYLTTSQPYYGKPAKNDLIVSVRKIENKRKTVFRKFILILPKEGKNKLIFRCLDTLHAYLKKKFPHISDK